LKSLLKIDSQRTFEETIRRLSDNKIITRLEKGKYQIVGRFPSDFEIAQFIYNPSYISFETALSYCGILSQFPFEITSATTKKRAIKKVDQKTYSYIHINKSLFTGYATENNALVASPEKAVFDQFYLFTKGLKSLNAINEMDFSKVSKKKVLEYAHLLSNKQKEQVIKMVKQYI